ncbi:MAG: leucine-rich repeat domain-containing protein [Ruminococcus sp.]|nr:leucine-rich repeat domain-containing protein [Ruminococcus sp.]
MINLKKILSCAIMVLCIVSLFSCGDSKNSGDCGIAGGDNVKWKLDENGILTISGKGEMASYLGYHAEWASKSKKDTIKKVVIEDGVTNIGHDAFYECSNITEIDIPDSVTEIGMYAFYGCSSLSEVTIPDNITTIETYTFGNCENLQEIVIPDSVQTIERCAFLLCKSLTEINIPDSVEIISESAFAGCENLKKVTIPETLKEIEKDAFGNTEFLNQYARKNQPLIINNIVVDGSGCTGDVVIPDGVTEIGKEAFALTEYYDYDSITSVVLPDSIRTIRAGAFAYCKDLEEINFPEGLKVIEGGAFAGCGNMPFIVFLPESLEEIHSIGHDVTSLVVLNPELDISFFHVNKAEWAKIYCPRGSKAQEYAEEMGYECILLEEMQDVNEFLISNLYNFEY